jgi:hypothetical protein
MRFQAGNIPFLVVTRLNANWYERFSNRPSNRAGKALRVGASAISGFAGEPKFPIKTFALRSRSDLTPERAGGREGPGLNLGGGRGRKPANRGARMPSILPTGFIFRKEWSKKLLFLSLSALPHGPRGFGPGLSHAVHIALYRPAAMFYTFPSRSHS